MVQFNELHTITDDTPTEPIKLLLFSSNSDSFTTTNNPAYGKKHGQNLAKVAYSQKFRSTTGQ